MNELQLRGDCRTALTHMTLIGLAAILEAAGVTDVRIDWTTALDSRPVVCTAIGFEAAAEIVRQHALERAADASWLAAVLTVDGREMGLLSPRIAVPKDQAAWQRLVDGRASRIDALVEAQAALDLQLVGALGTPAYWRERKPGDLRPDEGASGWEMKTRNQGQDFVRHRLFPIARHVASRDVASIRAGLEGTATVDLTDDPESHTATGLAAPGPTDTAAAWCALWAISQFPVVPLIRDRSRTAGHLRLAGTRGRGWLCIPMPTEPLALPRLRSIIVSGTVERVVRAHVAAEHVVRPALEARAARDWLVSRGIGAVASFPVQASDNPNAPELRALNAQLIRLEAACGDSSV